MSYHTSDNTHQLFVCFCICWMELLLYVCMVAKEKRVMFILNVAVVAVVRISCYHFFLSLCSSLFLPFSLPSRACWLRLYPPSCNLFTPPSGSIFNLVFHEASFPPRFHLSILALPIPIQRAIMNEQGNMEGEMINVGGCVAWHGLVYAHKMQNRYCVDTESRYAKENDTMRCDAGTPHVHVLDQV